MDMQTVDKLSYAARRITGCSILAEAFISSVRTEGVPANVDEAANLIREILDGAANDIEDVASELLIETKSPKGNSKS